MTVKFVQNICYLSSYSFSLLWNENNNNVGNQHFRSIYCVIVNDRAELFIILKRILYMLWLNVELVPRMLIPPITFICHLFLKTGF